MLKLNKLSEQELSNRELNSLKGGRNCCICACYYAGTSGNDGTYSNNHKIDDCGGYGNGAYS